MGSVPPKGFKERRHHKMYVTRNTEYHLRDDVCVGIRDLRTGRWASSSGALRARLLGSIKDLDAMILSVDREPRVGECLLFINRRGDDIVTTCICDIRRPPKEAVEHYVPNGLTPLDDETSSEMGV
jgi:hypothetical protein